MFMSKPNPLTRAIIDATVDRGLNAISEDPNRSIRKLADMGREFARGRFLTDIYGMVQDLLKNDDSPYYALIEELLQHTNRRTLIDFGINFGYNGLTVGGRTIRELSKKVSHRIPWMLSFEYHPEKAGSITLTEIADCIRQGQEFGIYCYTIALKGKLLDPDAFIRLFQRNPECAFLLILPEINLDPSAAKAFSICTNLMLAFHGFSERTCENIRISKEEKLLISVYASYSDASILEESGKRLLSQLASSETAFGFLIAGDSCTAKTRDKVAQYSKIARLHPAYPMVLFDLPGDVLQIGKTISADEAYLCILENGDLQTESGVITDFRHTTSLEHLFSIAFPEEAEKNAG